MLVEAQSTMTESGVGDGLELTQTLCLGCRWKLF